MQYGSLSVSVTSHFDDVLKAAAKHHATHASIQSYFTFVNFETREDAVAFLAAMIKDGKCDSRESVNTDRPFVPFEVMVPHPHH